MRDTVARRSTLSVLSLVLVLAALTIVACGDDDDGGSSGSGGGDGGGSAKIAEAEGIVKEAMAPVTEFTGPTESPKPAEDKSILVINCAGVSVGCTSQTRSAATAAETMGWDVKVIDGKGDPAKYNDAIQQGISLGVDGIVLASIDQRLVKDTLQQARKEGIHVVSQWSGNLGPSAAYAKRPDAPDGKPTESTVEMETPQPDVMIARAQAAWTTVNSDGKAKVLMFETPENSNESTKAEEYKKQLAELCPDCEVVFEQDINHLGASTGVPQVTQAQLSSHPDIDTIWASYDDIGILADQGLKQISRTDDVAIIGSVGLEVTVDAICSGESGFQATYAEASIWPGHGSVDALNRLFNDEEVATDELFEQYQTPSRLITKDNCEEIDGPWLGDYDIPAAWQDLWNSGS